MKHKKSDDFLYICHIIIVTFLMDSDHEMSNLFLKINQSDSGKISKVELQEIMPSLTDSEINKIIQSTC